MAYPCHGWPRGCPTAQPPHRRWELCEGGVRARRARARACAPPAVAVARRGTSRRTHALATHNPVLLQHPPAGSAPTPPPDPCFARPFGGGEEAPRVTQGLPPRHVHSRARCPHHFRSFDLPLPPLLSPLSAPSRVFPTTPRLGGAVAHPLGALPARRPVPASISPHPPPSPPQSPLLWLPLRAGPRLFFLSCRGKQLPPADVSAPHCRGGGGSRAAYLPCPLCRRAPAARGRTAARRRTPLPRKGAPTWAGRWRLWRRLGPSRRHRQRRSSRRRPRRRRVRRRCGHPHRRPRSRRQSARCRRSTRPPGREAWPPCGRSLTRAQTPRRPVIRGTQPSTGRLPRGMLPRCVRWWRLAQALPPSP